VESINSSNSKNQIWHIYMVRTKHGQLYTGITQDIARRFMEHKEGGKKTAKYLRGKGPLELVFHVKIGSRSSALKAEFALKKLTKEHKERLAKNSIRFHEVIVKNNQKNNTNI
jgi:putative endonuclease